MANLLNPTFNDSGEVISKQCRRCQKQKSIEDFYRHGKGQRTAICKSCHSDVYRPKYAQQKKERKDPLHRPKYILKDAKGTDKKLGFTNDLTTEWIADCIKDGCCYCGNKTLKMSLDRIDNNLPHTKDNVKPACIRCNFIRKTMPYNAWMKIVPGLRVAEEQGLFENWTGVFDHSGRKRKY